MDKKIDNDYVLSFRLPDSPFVSGEWFEATAAFTTVGTYKGDFEITTKMIDDFVTNFKLGVVRRWKDKNGAFRLKMNYDHYSERKAGWIVDVEARDKQLSDGIIARSLWLKPEYLPDAVEAKQKGYYEYFSIEYSLKYWDDQKQMSYENVLTGGALTDNPFAMELEPIALSTILKNREKKEIVPTKIIKEEDKMDGLLKALRSAGVQLSANPTESEIVLKFDALMKSNDELTKNVSDTTEKLTTATTELTDIKEKLTVADGKAKEFDTYKSGVDEKRKVDLITLAIKEEKYSKAECEDDGVFGEIILNSGLDKAEVHLTKVQKRFADKKITVADGEVDLSNDEAYAKELKRLSTDEKISIDEADAKLKLKKNEQINNKEVT